MSGVEFLEQARTVFPDTSVRRLAMDRLLSQVLDAHGGLDRWSGIQTLTVRVS